jgi:hypothetical protein
LPLFVYFLDAPNSHPCILNLFVEVWSNFEIGDLDFWRGEAYSKFFDHLDEAGGFYYEVSIYISAGQMTPLSSPPSTIIAMGRCSHSQHRCLSICAERADREFLPKIARTQN